MKKIVDVFVTDRLVASYPIVAEQLAGGPTPNDDERFVEPVKAQMQGAGPYSEEELAAAKFVVRGLLDWTLAHARGLSLDRSRLEAAAEGMTDLKADHIE